MGESPTECFDAVVSQYRGSLPIVEDNIYLDNAGLAPISEFVMGAITENLNIRATSGKKGVKATFEAHVTNARRQAAKLLGTTEEHIGLMRNTTEGLNVISNGMKWKAGQNVLVPDNEFPANVYPWLRLQGEGVEIRRVPNHQGEIRLEDIESLMDENTRMLTISHVGYISGFRADLQAIGELCRAHDVLFIVDAAQSMGALDIDVVALGIDALAGSGWKWLLGPVGTGLLYMSPKMLELVAPIFVGAGTMVHGHFGPAREDIKVTAARYEFSTLDIATVCGVEAALTWINKLGTKRIEPAVTSMAAELRELLAPLDVELYRGPGEACPEQGAGIVSVRSNRVEGEVLLEKMHERNVHCGHWYGYLRLAPHFFNTRDELRGAVDTLAAVLDETAA